MNTSTTILVISLVAGAVTFILTVRVFHINLTRSKASKAIAETQAVGKTVVLESGRLAGLARTIAEAGLNLTPARFILLTIGLAIGGTLFAWVFFLPGLPAIAIGGILAYVPYATITDRIASRGRRIAERLGICGSRSATPRSPRPLRRGWRPKPPL